MAGGLHEDVEVTNLSATTRRVRMQLRFGTDFADLQAIQRGRTVFTRAVAEVDRNGESITSRRPGRRGARARATTIRFRQTGKLSPTQATFDVTLRPGESWSTCVDVEVSAGGETCQPLLGCHQFGQPLQDMPIGFTEWMTQAPRVETDSDVIQRSVEQGLADLAALRLRPNRGLPWSIPAGGMPWFMALFGRDTIWAAYQALPFHSELAQTALTSLAAYQADADDPYRDAEPEKFCMSFGEARWPSRARCHTTPTTAVTTHHRSSSCCWASTTAGPRTPTWCARWRRTCGQPSLGSTATAISTATAYSNTGGARRRASKTNAGKTPTTRSDSLTAHWQRANRDLRTAGLRLSRPTGRGESAARGARRRQGGPGDWNTTPQRCSAGLTKATGTTIAATTCSRWTARNSRSTR